MEIHQWLLDKVDPPTPHTVGGSDACTHEAHSWGSGRVSRRRKKQAPRRLRIRRCGQGFLSRPSLSGARSVFFHAVFPFVVDRPGLASSTGASCDDDSRDPTVAAR